MAGTQATYRLGTAGTALLDTSGGRLTIVSVTPVAGWTVDRAESDGTSVEIRLESASGEVRFEASLVGGVVRVSLDTDDDSSGSGSGGDDDNSGSGSGNSGPAAVTTTTVGRGPMTTEPARRRDPPAQLAKIATAGATGMFVFGLTAVMGWADRPTEEPGGLPAVPVSTAPPTTIAFTAPATVAPTTTLVPLATTIAPAPVPSPVPAPAPPTAPRSWSPLRPPHRPRAPVVVVSEQSQ